MSGDHKDGIQTMEYRQKKLTISQIHETMSLKEVERKGVDPSNSGNEWSF